MKRRKILSLILLAGTVLGAGSFDAVMARAKRGGSEESAEAIIAKAEKPWYFYYLAGLEQEDRQEWRLAKENLIISISVAPEPELRKRITSRRTVDYLPYLHLARAYYYLNDVSNAEKYLKISESKNIAPRDEIGKLWALIIAGRKKPLVFLYFLPERTPNSFVDIRGIAYDYHDVTRITVGDAEAIIREATIDDIKMLPEEPNINQELFLDKVYFEAVGVPLLAVGENVIKIRAYATNPDRTSDVYDFAMIREEKDKPTPKPAAVDIPNPMEGK